MSRPRRDPTWTYIDEELGHVPAEPGPEPRARHRHSRVQVRAQRQRAIARAERVVATWHSDANRQYWTRRLAATRTPRGWGNAYNRGWTKGLRYDERRLRDTETMDTAAALRCDGEDPEPETFDEEEEHDRLCLWLETGQDTVWYETPDTEEQ